ncbi:MAG: hypothetical protein VKO26_09220 [Cyanobacteriota bacterium]|nr:hypothetical protein [Cyanobacteriota bacterium]
MTRLHGDDPVPASSLRPPPPPSERGFQPRLLALALPALLGLPVVALSAAPVRADSRTAESIWSQSDAQQRATSQIPLADREGITQTRCQEVGVGRMGSLPRFRCTVWFTPVTPGAAGASGAPKGAGGGGGQP